MLDRLRNKRNKADYYDFYDHSDKNALRLNKYAKATVKEAQDIKKHLEALK